MRRKIALGGIVMFLLLASPALPDTTNRLIGDKKDKEPRGAREAAIRETGTGDTGGGRPEWAGKG